MMKKGNAVITHEISKQQKDNASQSVAKKTSTFTIGVLSSQLSDPFFVVALSEIERVVYEQGGTVIVARLPNDPDQEQRLLSWIKACQIAGLLVSTGEDMWGYGFAKTVEDAGIPVVSFDGVADTHHGHQVVSDLATGMCEAIALFASCGHHSISLINGPEQLAKSREREEAYRKGLRQEGISLKPEYMVGTDLTREGNELAISKLLALPDRPSAVVSFNDFVTLDVMKGVREKGLILNQDIHFISYAGYPLWEYMENPPMASIERFPGVQGAKAAQLLLELLHSKEQRGSSVLVVESQLIRRSI